MLSYHYFIVSYALSNIVIIFFVTLGRQFIKKRKENSNFFIGVIILELNCFMLTLSADTSKDLASELVHYAFINEVDIKAVFSSSVLFYFL